MKMAQRELHGCISEVSERVDVQAGVNVDAMLLALGTNFRSWRSALAEAK